MRERLRAQCHEHLLHRACESKRGPVDVCACLPVTAATFPVSSNAFKTFWLFGLKRTILIDLASAELEAAFQSMLETIPWRDSNCYNISTPVFTFCLTTSWHLHWAFHTRADQALSAVVAIRTPPHRDDEGRPWSSEPHDCPAQDLFANPGLAVQIHRLSDANFMR